ncbi:MAG: efflux RND transporter periplasmic adaptor subunit [Bacillota bacterium]
MRKKLGVFGFLIGAVLLVLTGCGSEKKGGVKEEEIAKPVVVSAVARGEIERINTVSGRVGPAVEVKVVPKIGGKVAEVAVEVGDEVKPGQVLIRLDTTDVAVQVKQAEAAVATARANLNNLLAGTRPEQLAQAQAGLQAAQAGLDNARANHANSLANLERMRYLFDQGAVAKQQLEAVETQAQVAAGGLILAEAQLRQAEQGLLMAQAGPTPEMIDIARAQVKQAEAGLESARHHLANCVITAPVAGRVSARYVEQGEMAGPTMPVVTLVQLDPAVVEIQVTEEYINLLTPGQELAVRVKSAAEQPLKGRIKTVSPAADPRSRAYQVKVEMTNSDGTLKPGMTAALEIPLERKEGVIAVPLSAVLDRGGQKVAFVAKDNTVEMRELLLGIEGDAMVEVAKGLNEGELLVIAGQHLLSGGDRVTVQEGGR